MKGSHYIFCHQIHSLGYINHATGGLGVTIAVQELLSCDPLTTVALTTRLRVPLHDEDVNLLHIAMLLQECPKFFT